MMTEKDVFRACCGRNEEGETRCAVQLQTILINTNSANPETRSEMNLNNPVVNIFRTLTFTMVDLTFDFENDHEFMQMADMLQEFCDVENAMDTVSSVIPSIVVTLLPKDLDYEFFCSGLQGIWCLMPSRVGRPFDTVRFIFNNESFRVYQTNTDELERQITAEMENIE